MPYDEQNQITRRIEILKRRKSYLEVQLARQGYNADPSILMEIEDIDNDIEDLLDQSTLIDQNELNVNSKAVLNKGEYGMMSRIEIIGTLLEKAEHVSQGMRTVRGYFYRNYPESKEKSDNNKTWLQDQSLINMINVLNGRIENFTSLHRKFVLFVPSDVNDALRSYVSWIVSDELSVDSVKNYLDRTAYYADDNLKAAVRRANDYMEQFYKK